MVGGFDRRHVAGEGLTSCDDLARSIRSNCLSQIQRTSTTLGQLEHRHSLGHASRYVTD
jgi:hypothetical protein